MAQVLQATAKGCNQEIQSEEKGMRILCKSPLPRVCLLVTYDVWF